MYYISEQLNNGKYVVTNTYNEESKTMTEAELRAFAANEKVEGVSTTCKVVNLFKLFQRTRVSHKLMGLPVLDVQVVKYLDKGKRGIELTTHDVAYEFKELAEYIKRYSGELKIPKYVTIISGNFSGVMAQLRKLVLPEEIDIIEAEAFMNCICLDIIENFDSVKEIGAKAFYGCTDLDTVKLGSKLQKLGVGAFRKCKCLCICRL